VISTSRTLLVSVRSPLSCAAGALNFRALQRLSATPFSGYAESSQRYEYTFPSFCGGEVPKPETGLYLTMRRQRSHVLRRDVAIVSETNELDKKSHVVSSHGGLIYVVHIVHYSSGIRRTCDSCAGAGYLVVPLALYISTSSSVLYIIAAL